MRGKKRLTALLMVIVMFAVSVSVDYGVSNAEDSLHMGETGSDTGVPATNTDATDTDATGTDADVNRYSLNIENNSNATIQYYEENEPKTLCTWSDTVMFENGKSYRLVITAHTENLILNISGIGGERTEYDNTSSWRQVFTSDLITGTGEKIVINEEKPKITFNILTSEILLGYETLIQYTAEPDWNLKIGETNFQLYSDENCQNLISNDNYTLRGSRLTLHYNEKMEGYDTIYIKIECKIGEVTITSEPKQLTIKRSNIIYGKDYEIKNSENRYAYFDTNSDGKNQVFFRSNGAPVIQLYNKNYNKYRYVFDTTTIGEDMPDSDINDTEEIAPFSGSMCTIQMLKENSGAVSSDECGYLTLFWDYKRPIVKNVTPDDDTLGIQSDSYKLNKNSVLSFKVYDVGKDYNYDTNSNINNDSNFGVKPSTDTQNFYSGIKEVYYIAEGSNKNTKLNFDSSTGTVTISADNLESGSNKVIRIYAVDNVGNVSDPFKIKYELDKCAPSIDVDLNEYFVADPENPNTYYYSFKRVEADQKADQNVFRIKISDENLNLDNIIINKVSQTNETNNLINGGKDYVYEFSIDSTDENEYTIDVSAVDLFKNGIKDNVIENKKTYKIIVDNTPPKEVYAYAVPISFNNCTNGNFGLENLPDSYIGYNDKSILSIVCEDKNIDVKTAFSINIFGENIDKKVPTNTEKNQDKYIVNYSFKCILKNEKIINNNDPKECYVTVTDKAGNSIEKRIYTTPKENVPANEEAKYLLSGTTKKLAYIKNEIVLKSINMNCKEPENSEDSGNSETIMQNFFHIVDGNISGEIIFDNAKCINAEFLSIFLVTAGKDKEKIEPNKIDTQVPNKLAFSFPADSMKVEINKTYQLQVYYFDVATGYVNKLEPSQRYWYDNIPPKLCSIVDSNKNQIIYCLKEDNPIFSRFTINIEKALNHEEDYQQYIINAIHSLMSEKWNNGKLTIQLKEGEYNIDVIAVDIAGNESKLVHNEFTFDKTAPKVTNISAESVIYSSKTDYGIFINEREPFKLSFEVEELVGDVEMTCIARYTNGNEIEYNSDKNKPGKEIIVVQDKSKFTCSMEVPADFKGTLYYTISDGNGNEIKGEYDVTVENNEKHQATSSVSIIANDEASARNGIYNTDIKLSLEATDTFSGIREIKYDINTTEVNESITLDQKGGIQTEWSLQDLIVPATIQNEGNEIPVTFRMIDNAGHESVVTKTYKIDITKPVVSVTYNNNMAINEEYYNATRTATVRVTDVNFDSSGVALHVTKNGTPMSIEPDFVNEEGDTYVMNIPLTEDGDYEVSVAATDLAGNVSDYARTDRFTIDKTLPEMTITYDNNTPFSENYYSESRTATVTVKEQNFDTKNIDLNVTAKVDGKGVEAPSVSAFTSNGDTHTATITFDKDGDYTISAAYGDLAGNEGSSIAEQSFTIDLTAPEIEIAGVKANASYAGNITPVVTVTDGNYDKKGVTISIAGSKHGNKELTGKIEDIAHGQTFSYSDLKHVQENDDCYSITVKAVDKAGHETEKTINYKVNRFGSVYTVNEELQHALEQYYAPASDKYVIIEENVDKLKTYKLTCTIDNEIVNLVEGVHYTVKQSTNSDKWQQYEYSLNAGTFDREGVYNISVSSEDTNGNISDNKSKNMEVEFCIDNTKPVCIISGVADGEKLAKDAPANVVIEAYDNIKFSDMTVMLNGRQIKTEADMVDGKVSFKIDPSGGKQTLQVICHDAAGNEEIQELRFTFNVGIFGLPVWLIVAIIAALAVLAGLIIILILKRRKEQD